MATYTSAPPNPTDLGALHQFTPVPTSSHQFTQPALPNPGSKLLVLPRPEEAFGSFSRAWMSPWEADLGKTLLNT